MQGDAIAHVLGAGKPAGAEDESRDDQAKPPAKPDIYQYDVGAAILNGVGADHNPLNNSPSLPSADTDTAEFVPVATTNQASTASRPHPNAATAREPTAATATIPEASERITTPAAQPDDDAGQNPCKEASGLLAESTEPPTDARYAACVVIMQCGGEEHTRGIHMQLAYITKRSSALGRDSCAF